MRFLNTETLALICPVVDGVQVGTAEIEEFWLMFELRTQRVAKAGIHGKFSELVAAPDQEIRIDVGGSGLTDCIGSPVSSIVVGEHFSPGTVEACWNSAGSYFRSKLNRPGHTASRSHHTERCAVPSSRSRSSLYFCPWYGIVKLMVPWFGFPFRPAALIA